MQIKIEKKKNFGTYLFVNLEQAADSPMANENILTK